MKIFMPLLLLLLMTGCARVEPPAPKVEGAEDVVADILRESEALKPGMTRADVLKYFKKAGGLNGFFVETYESKRCGLIKVDVKFNPPAGPHADRFNGTPTDVIISISKPYVGWVYYH